MDLLEHMISYFKNTICVIKDLNVTEGHRLIAGKEPKFNELHSKLKAEIEHFGKTMVLPKKLVRMLRVKEMKTVYDLDMIFKEINAKSEYFIHLSIEEERNVDIESTSQQVEESIRKFLIELKNREEYMDRLKIL